MPDCMACASGPSGIAGHENLFSETMGATRMHFRCRACKRLWVRHYRDGGDFLWRPSEGKLHDADTPGRVGTSPP